MTNPYAAPESVVDHALASKWAVAVVIGAAVGSGFASVVVRLMSTAVLWLMYAQGIPRSEFYHYAYGSMTLALGPHVLGFIGLAAGGFWSAKLASDRPVSTALLSGVVVLCLALPGVLLPWELPGPTWSTVLSLTLPIPAYWIGARWWMRKAAAKAAGWDR